MNPKQTTAFVNQVWDSSILPTLMEYIRIPNKSPAFDPHWQANGHMEAAVALLVKWCEQQAITGMQLQVHRLPNRTPLILIEFPGQTDKTVLLYGHLDKQPEMEGWDKNLGPWQPVLQNDRLYGRGAADDGYAIFAALTAIKALQKQNTPHAHCIVIIEACEESGSDDLPYYIDHLQTQIGSPDLVICLDSGCGNYDQLWCTTSLRGVICGELNVEILKEGVHSGAASGIVPSSFRILRQLLSRIEDEQTGHILIDELHVPIPEERITEAKMVAKELGDKVWTDYPFVKNAKPVSGQPYELILNRTWKPALSITGIAHIPNLDNAGNVLRPQTAIILSMRTPPTCDIDKAMKKLKTTLETNPPYCANVSFKPKQSSSGWNAPVTKKWLNEAINTASNTYFDRPALNWGEGGTIPFMAMLGKKFPNAQFVITGILGPNSNAHGPNEFLDIPTAKKLTCCIADILATHYNEKNS